MKSNRTLVLQMKRWECEAPPPPLFVPEGEVKQAREHFCFFHNMPGRPAESGRIILESFSSKTTSAQKHNAAGISGNYSSLQIQKHLHEQ